jgi:DNA polymerase/3'-5' exonuclease PolX
MLQLRMPISAEDRVTEIAGIGDVIADIVTKLNRNGTHPVLEAMRKQIPHGVFEMLAVSGLRPDKSSGFTRTSVSPRSRKRRHCFGFETR